MLYRTGSHSCRVGFSSFMRSWTGGGLLCGLVFTLLCYYRTVSSGSKLLRFSLALVVPDVVLILTRRNSQVPALLLKKMSKAPAAVTAPDFPWGQVQQLQYQEANTGTIVQACHAMIYARTNAKFVSQLPCKAWVMMQMR